MDRFLSATVRSVRLWRLSSGIRRVLERFGVKFFALFSLSLEELCVKLCGIMGSLY